MRKNTARVTLDLGPDALRRLTRLQEALEDVKKIDVFKKSLQWLEYVVDIEEEGGRLLAEDKDGKQRELVVLGASRRNSS